jgi:hypothetical protein
MAKQKRGKKANKKSKRKTPGCSAGSKFLLNYYKNMAKKEGRKGANGTFSKAQRKKAFMAYLEWKRK